MGFHIFLLDLGQYWYINKLNVFAMAVMFVTTSALVINDLGNVFFSCILERILFIVSLSSFIFAFNTRFVMHLFCTYAFLKKAVVRCQVSPNCLVFR